MSHSPLFANAHAYANSLSKCYSHVPKLDEAIHYWKMARVIELVPGQIDKFVKFSSTSTVFSVLVPQLTAGFMLAA